MKVKKSGASYWLGPTIEVPNFGAFVQVFQIFLFSPDLQSSASPENKMNLVEKLVS